MHNLKDKIILVSKRKIDNDGNETSDTYFGKVKVFSDNTIIVTKPDGDDESLPNGDELYDPAEQGFYELEDGSTYENPDFIAEFVVYETNEAYEKFQNRNP